ncbi:MAG: DegV family protein [Leptolinea sp.]|jgi:DegV family protein with EDD domain|nr:DegV family protein [Leptolinea sp.]
MQIVTDSGMDLSETDSAGLDIHTLPLRITLNGKTYVGGKDIDYVTFYQILTDTGAFPITSQPSPGDFADLYRELAKTDPDILSIHISSGLSGTCNSARLGAQMVPEAHVTILDSKTLSGPLGWQVQAAAHAMRTGWVMGDIIKLVDQIRENQQTLFTLGDLKYLIHGGRISHLKGLLASMLNIKPIIGVAKDDGKYYNWGQAPTLRRAIHRMADIVAQKFSQNIPLRIQFIHGNNMEGVNLLKERIASMFDCVFDETLPVAPVLGAHTGPSVVGIAAAPLYIFEKSGLNLLHTEKVTA